MKLTITNDEYTKLFIRYLKTKNVYHRYREAMKLSTTKYKNIKLRDLIKYTTSIKSNLNTPFSFFYWDYTKERYVFWVDIALNWSRTKNEYETIKYNKLKKENNIFNKLIKWMKKYI